MFDGHELIYALEHNLLGFPVRPAYFKLLHARRLAKTKVNPQIRLRIEAPPTEHFAAQPATTDGAEYGRTNRIARAFLSRVADQFQSQPVPGFVCCDIAQQGRSFVNSRKENVQITVVVKVAYA